MKKPELIIRNLSKNKKENFIILFGVIIFELFMIIRGGLVFNFSKIRHVQYFSLYFVLLFFTVISTLFFYIYLRNLKKNKSSDSKWFVIWIHFYMLIICSWSAYVSFLDMQVDNYPIVFITVLMSIPCLCILNPFVFSAISLSSSLILIILRYTLIDIKVSGGFLINMILFLIINIFETFTIYNISTKRNVAFDKIESLSLLDQLTSLNNRRSLDERIASLVNKEETYNIIMLDINSFKSVNDTYGHQVGDECLKLVADKLKEHFIDDCYRYGGDEFMIITSLKETEARKIIEEVNNELYVVSSGNELSISYGIYHVKKADKAKNIFINVDQELYKAKELYKEKVKLYH